MKKPQEISPPLMACIKQTYQLNQDPVLYRADGKGNGGALISFELEATSYLLKIVVIHGMEQVAEQEERLKFANFVSSKGVQSIKALAGRDGAFVHGFEDERYYMFFAWEKALGHHCHLTDPLELHDFYRDWGSLLGRLHQLSRAYSGLVSDSSQGSFIHSQECWKGEWAYFYSIISDDKIKQAWVKMRSLLESLPKREDNFGFIHNDLHPYNLLQNNEGLVILDWDVANIHWFMIDIGIAIFSEYARISHHSEFSYRKEHMKEAFIRPFMQGYCQHNQLSGGDMEHLELFINYRRFIMYGIFHDEIKRGNPVYFEKFKQEISEFEPFLGEGFSLGDYCG